MHMRYDSLDQVLEKLTQAEAAQGLRFIADSDFLSPAPTCYVGVRMLECMMEDYVSWREEHGVSDRFITDIQYLLTKPRHRTFLASMIVFVPGNGTNREALRGAFGQLFLMARLRHKLISESFFIW